MNTTPPPISEQFPNTHVFAAGFTAIVLMLVLLLWPTQDLEAKRVSLHLPLEVEAKEYLMAHFDESSEDWEEWKISSGDSLSILGNKMGIPSQQISDIMQSNARMFANLHPGDRFSLQRDPSGEAQKLRLVKSPLLYSEIVWKNGVANYQEIERHPDVHINYIESSITESLSASALAAGLDLKTTMELANIFAWDIDFALDIRKGDSFQLIYEEHFLNGDKIGNGPILAAKFSNRGKTITAIRYENQDGQFEYYTPEGRALRKAFLRSPMDFTRITSRFNPNRLHPIFKTKRPHRGVDYGASRGTPIKTTSNGRVVFAGVKGGYGNVVIIKHGRKYSTLYGHMHKFAKGIRKGSKVKQGQVIGYVGSTGYATGPHLHYELRVDGVHRDPLKVKLPNAQPMATSLKKDFNAYTKGLLAQMNIYKEATQLASLSPID